MTDYVSEAWIRARRYATERVQGFANTHRKKFEDGRITRAYGNGTYDVLIPGRAYPYEALRATDPGADLRVNDPVRVVFEANNPFLPQILSLTRNRLKGFAETSARLANGVWTFSQGSHRRDNCAGVYSTLRTLNGTILVTLGASGEYPLGLVVFRSGAETHYGVAWTELDGATPTGYRVERRALSGSLLYGWDYTSTPEGIGPYGWGLWVTDDGRLIGVCDNEDLLLAAWVSSGQQQRQSAKTQSFLSVCEQYLLDTYYTFTHSGPSYSNSEWGSLVESAAWSRTLSSGGLKGSLRADNESITDSWTVDPASLATLTKGVVSDCSSGSPRLGWPGNNTGAYWFAAVSAMEALAVDGNAARSALAYEYGDAPLSSAYPVSLSASNYSKLLQFTVAKLDAASGSVAARWQYELSATGSETVAPSALLTPLADALEAAPSSWPAPDFGYSVTHTWAGSSTASYPFTHHVSGATTRIYGFGASFANTLWPAVYDVAVAAPDREVWTQRMVMHPLSAGNNALVDVPPDGFAGNHNNIGKYTDWISGLPAGARLGRSIAVDQDDNLYFTISYPVRAFIGYAGTVLPVPMMLTTFTAALPGDPQTDPLETYYMPGMRYVWRTMQVSLAGDSLTERWRQDRSQSVAGASWHEVIDAISTRVGGTTTEEIYLADNHWVPNVPIGAVVITVRDAHLEGPDHMPTPVVDLFRSDNGEPIVTGIALTQTADLLTEDAGYTYEDEEGTHFVREAWAGTRRWALNGANIRCKGAQTADGGGFAYISAEQTDRSGVDGYTRYCYLKVSWTSALAVTQEFVVPTTERVPQGAAEWDSLAILSDRIAWISAEGTDHAIFTS